MNMIEELNLTTIEKSTLENLKIGRTVLYTSRQPRTGKREIDGREYHFRTYDFIKSLDNTQYIIAPVRSDIQAIDTKDVGAQLQENDIVFIEVFHSFISELKKWLDSTKSSDFKIITIFLMPISFSDLGDISRVVDETEENIVHNLMKKKLILRAADPPNKIEERAASAWREIQDAIHYDYRIVNHFGEDDMRPWNALFPEVLLVLKQFINIILREPNNKKLIILSGPSCVGKGPLWKTFNKVCSSLTED